MRGLKVKGKARPKPQIDSKGIVGLADAMNALGAGAGAPAPVPMPPGPPDASAGPMPAPPMPGPPPVGAADGLGAGMGGLAVHPSLKAAKITGYEPRHSSKHR